jgi:uncharacterized membrane protein YhhN
MLNRPLFIGVLVVSALLAIAGSTLGGDVVWLQYVFKPATDLLILVAVWRVVEPGNAAYRHAILAGLLLSLIGDVLLMLPKTVLGLGFEYGLGSFLFAHLFFLRAYTRDASLFGKPGPLLFLLTLCAGNLLVLWPSIAPALHLPILAYMMCLVGMCAQSASRALSLRTKASRTAACGALAFLLSDILFAYNQFHAPVPASALLILGSYYLAIYWIALSVLPEPACNAS